MLWERITEHYNTNRPDGVRPLRSLETKWGLIKHIVSKFYGIYNQIQHMHKSGSSAAYTLRDANELYRQKNSKKTDFIFEHCWLVLKDWPRWADGWIQSPMRKKRPNHEYEGSNTQDVYGGISEGATRSQSVYNERPGEVKAAKQDNMQQKTKDNALYAQAEATRSMAAVQMKKMVFVADQNILLLMTMPIEDIAGENAREYLRRRRGKELKKLKKRLSDEEFALQAQEARELADAVVVVPDAAANCRGGTLLLEASTSDGGGSPGGSCAPTEAKARWDGAPAPGVAAAPRGGRDAGLGRSAGRGGKIAEREGRMEGEGGKRAGRMDGE